MSLDLRVPFQILLSVSHSTCLKAVAMSAGGLSWVSFCVPLCQPGKWGELAARGRGWREGGERRAQRYLALGFYRS